MREEKSISDYIGQALAKADAEAIRAILGNLLQKRLEDYDCRDIIAKAMTPFIQEIVKGLLQEQALHDALVARVKQQALVAIGSLKISFDGRW